MLKATKKPARDYLDLLQVRSALIPDQLWLLDGVIPQRAVTAVAAAPKMGKSTIVYGLLGAAFREEEFLDRPTVRLPTLIVHPDEGIARVRFKVNEYGFPEDAPIWFLRTTMKLRGEGAWRRVLEVLGETKARILVIDSVSNFWDIKDENSNAEVSDWMARVMDLAENGGITVILIYHHGQRGRVVKAAGASMRGATAFFQCLDQGIDVFQGESDIDKNERLMKILGRFDESPNEMRYTLHEATFKSVADYDDDGKADRLEVLKSVLKPDAWVGADGLAKAARMGLKTLRKLLSPLPPWLERRGSGIKGDPRIYRLKEEAHP
jgi:hypothetical protein